MKLIVVVQKKCEKEKKFFLRGVVFYRCYQRIIQNRYSDHRSKMWQKKLNSRLDEDAEPQVLGELKLNK